MSTYSNLSVELIGTGEQDGTWGSTTNVNFGTALEEAIVGTVDQAVSTGDTTLSWSTSSNATQVARHLRLNLTGSAGGSGNLIIPTTAAGGANTFTKSYIINNASNTAITVKTASGSGVLVPAGKSACVYADGTNVDYAIDYLSGSVLSSDVDINGGTIDNTTIGASTASTGAFTTLSASSTVSGTGFSTYLASPPAIGGSSAAAGAFTTLSASSTVSGTGFSTYLASPPAIGGTSAGAGSFTTLSASSTVSGTGFSTYLASPPAIGSSAPAAGAFTTLSATSTVSGSGFSNFASLNNYSPFVNSTEKVTVSATAATGTINYDTDTQSVLYYTSAAAGDWTVNFRDSSGTSLDSVLAVGEAITLVHLVTITGSEYRNTTVQVDGSSITPEWQGGSAPTEGNANSIDSYTYTIIKTGSAAFTILAALTQFA